MSNTSYAISTEKSWDETRRELAHTFELWGVQKWHIEYGGDNRRRAMRGQAPEHRAVGLVYELRGRTVRLVMDRQDRAVDNLRVLYLAVEAMRLNEKRGVGEVLADAYSQMALPAPATAQHPAVPHDPYTVLGVRPDSPMVVIEAAYRTLAKLRHPDAGGNDAAMRELNEALEQIRRLREA